MPGVSVVIPVRNGEKSIGKCLESVLASKYQADHLEVICVDNHSTDGTASVLRRFQPRIRVVEESRRGPGAARNAGLRVATREFVAFTDADCMVDPNWLPNILKPLQENSGAAGGRILARPGAGAVEQFGELIHDHAAAIERDRPPYLITMNMASRVSLLRSIGLFDERWLRMEDCEISYRILQTGAQIGYRGDAVVYHHNRDTLATLAREGFLHGYYTPAFRRTQRKFVEEYKRQRQNQPCGQPSQRPPAESRLAPWRVRLYWRVFRISKFAGTLAGRWSPPPVE